MNHASLIGKPGSHAFTGKINVWFADEETVYFQVNHIVKTSLQNNPKPIHPALFQIAARIETTNLSRISKATTEELRKVNAISGLDADELNLGGRNEMARQKQKAEN